MLVTTTITQKWQMTLPKDIRQFLGIKKPGQVTVEVVDLQRKLLRIQKRSSFLKMAGILPAKNKKGQTLDVLKIRDLMEKEYSRQWKRFS